ncbi:MAG: aspartate--tRNA ligase [Parachlamydiaceae bacterium]
MTHYRTHNLGTLRAQDVGVKTTLSGWVHKRRDHGGLIFIDLRDRYGCTQLVFDPACGTELFAEAEKLRSEWVLRVEGIVISRKPGMENSKLATGSIEVAVSHLEVLSKAKTAPFPISDDEIEVHEDIRLKYRYLDIRRGAICKNLVLRHQAMLETRNYLSKKGFLEINTPILGKSTPEGARDYLVPSRTYPGTFFALPQSPQLFKQLLMVSGMDRYFQIAPCFRDEDLRSDRQPEFSQIDMEMSFSTAQELMEIVEGLLKALFKECLNIGIQLPIQVMKHSEAMEKYGTDKPDLRFGMPLANLNSIASASSFTVFHEELKQGGTVKGLCIKGGSDLSRKQIDDYTRFVSQFGIQGLAWMKMQDGALNSNIVKFFPEDQQRELIDTLSIQEGDLIFMVASIEDRVNQALDHLRRKIAKDRNLIDSDALAFLWVIDFPLFAWNHDEGRLEAMHHPFTSPLNEDIPLMKSEPLKVRSSGYDIVLNGYEIGGGSVRIHNSELQKELFGALNLSEKEITEKFGFFVEALQYGTPPHLGLALGLDRIIMLMAKTENIRDVIAFPKTQRASDLMMDCPSPVATKQLRELALNPQIP